MSFRVSTDDRVDNGIFKESLLIPVKSAATEPVRPKGSIFYDTVTDQIYLSTGASYSAMAAGGGLADADADTSITVEQGGADTDTIIATTGGVERLRISDTGDLTITGDVHITGDLHTDGAYTLHEVEKYSVADSHIHVNAGYAGLFAEKGGIVVTYLATATTTTAAAGGFTSATEVTTTGAATFAAGDIIQISGANNAQNVGLYQVVSHAANVLTISAAPTHKFCDTGFLVDVDDAVAVITKVNVSAIQATDVGGWEVGSGSTAAGVTSSIRPLPTRAAGATTDTAITYWNGTAGELAGSAITYPVAGTLRLDDASAFTIDSIQSSVIVNAVGGIRLDTSTGTVIATSDTVDGTAPIFQITSAITGRGAHIKMAQDTAATVSNPDGVVITSIDGYRATDAAGWVQFTTLAAAGHGTFDVAFNQAYANAPSVVIALETANPSVVNMIYLTTVATTGFTVAILNTAAVHTSKIHYHVIEV